MPFSKRALSSSDLGAELLQALWASHPVLPTSQLFSVRGKNLLALPLQSVAVGAAAQPSAPPGRGGNGDVVDEGQPTHAASCRETDGRKEKQSTEMLQTGRCIPLQVVGEQMCRLRSERF